MRQEARQVGGERIIEYIIYCVSTESICQQVDYWLISCDKTGIFVFEEHDLQRFAFSKEAVTDVAGHDITVDVRDIGRCLEKGLP